MKTTVTSCGQTVVPAKIRKDHQVGSHTQLEWIDNGETIRVVPLPADTVRTAKGSTKGLRQKLLEEQEWEGSAFQDFVERATVDNKMLQRIVNLIIDTLRHPFSGLGQPEPLRRTLRGY